MSENNGSTQPSGVPKGNPANQGLDFATAILTTKSPQQAALILPNALNASTKLINHDLTKWFSEYSRAIRDHNNNLKRLVEQGAKMFTQEQFQGEYSNFPRYWNLTLDSVHNEIKNLEQVDRTVKKQILAPLIDAVDKDVRLSELMINSQELKELSGRMSGRGLTSEVELDWNYKAPASFASLESFKSYEIQLTFDVIFNFLSTHHDRLTKDLQVNEGSTKYLLNNYKLTDELNFYLDYLQRTEFKQAPGDSFVTNQVKEQQRQLNNSTAIHPVTKQKRSSVFPKNDIQSINSTTSSNTGKKTSSLKSKVGSIFGRKKKQTAFNPRSNFSNDAIAETESLSTTSSSQQLPSVSPTYPPQQDISRTHSFRKNSAVIQQGHPVPPQKVQPQVPAKQQKQQPPSQSYQQAERQAGSPSTFPVPGYYTNPSPFGDSPTTPDFSHPLVPEQRISTPPVVAKQGSSFVPPVTPTVESKFNAAPPIDSPNVVKYKESDSDSTSADEEEPQNLDGGNRLSMLQRHDLAAGSKTDEPTSTAQFGNEQARTLNPNALTSAAVKIPGSFPISPVEETAVPPSQDSAFHSLGSSNGATTESSVSAGEDYRQQRKPQYVSSLPVQETIPENATAFPDPNISPGSNVFQQHAPPPPPPSRKVVHHAEETNPARNRKDVHSQLFHNLPNARDSIIQPFGSVTGNASNSTASFGSATGGAQFVSQQDTGAALLKHNDYFKHFNGTPGDGVEGLNSSVSEVINTNFTDGKLTKSQIIGEVAFKYNPRSFDVAESQEPILLRIPDKFDKVILNPSFVEKSGSDNYKLNPALITSKTLGGLKYLIKLDEQEVPVLIQHVWKHEPHQSSLMINLKLNTTQYNTVPLVLQNLVVSAALKRDVATTSASSKPVGSFNIETNRITWRYTQPLVLGGGSHPTEEKIIARFLTKGTGSEHEAGVQLKFQIDDPSVHNAVIFDLNNDSREIPVSRHLVSGNYSGHSS